MLTKIFSLILLINSLLIPCLAKNYLKLELVQVLFRHGDRAAKQTEIYKTDPYDDLFKAIGYGQLTPIGKQREFNIGKMLRYRYNDFLGNMTLSDFYGRCTDSDRTKMSLKLVISGMTAPLEVERFGDTNWETIPITYKDSDTDFLLTYSHCPRYKTMLDEVEASPKYRKIMKDNKMFYKHLRKETKITTKRVFTPFLIHNTVRAAQSLGLPLPNWCSKNDYKKLYEITSYVYDAMSETKELKSLGTGLTIEEFLNNINDENRENKIKMYLYSAHDSNIALFTRSHNFTNIPINPDYGSTVIVEKLRGNDGKIYVQMLLWTGVTENLIPLELGKCGHTCLLDDYIDLVKPILPTNKDRECISGQGEHKVDSNEPKPSSNYLMAGEDLYSFKYPESYFA